MESKRCFKCGEIKPLTEFYKHSGMADGYLNKCKDCSKKDSINNRNKNIDKYREYDRKRGNRQDKSYIKEYRKKYPKKHKAQNLVNNNVRNGNLHKEPCCICGSNKNIVAHHDDYDKPLNVRWMCQACHVSWHKKNGEGANAS